MNTILCKNILEWLCERTHSQYGIVAINRASKVVVNKQNLGNLFRQESCYHQKDKKEEKIKEGSADANLQKKQQPAREQCIGLLGEDFAKKWASFS